MKTKNSSVEKRFEEKRFEEKQLEEMRFEEKLQITNQMSVRSFPKFFIFLSYFFKRTFNLDKKGSYQALGQVREKQKSNKKLSGMNHLQYFFIV